VIPAETFVTAARERGFALWSGVPCSYLKPFINYVIDAPELDYVVAANEGDAVAIAAGAELAGAPGIAMFQNSGLGNAVNPLTSLTYTFRIPILLIVTLRGDPESSADAPQHELMGRITGRLLETMEIPWEFFPADEEQIEGVVDRAREGMKRTGLPYALVMKKGTVAPRELESSAVVRGLLPETQVRPAPSPSMSRADVLRALQSATQSTDVIIAGTGYGGRELFALDDRPNQFYMVGSMGCASSLGLGIALTRPDRRVIVCDGDGAAIMRMGALATNGYQRPPNLLHIVLDNGMHESTGGQSTVSLSIDLCEVAQACGYQRILRGNEPGELTDILNSESSALTFVHVPIVPGTTADLPRPTLTPVQLANRFRQYIRES
jgi:phosphonopyruvate decarboxylase